MEIGRQVGNDVVYGSLSSGGQAFWNEKKQGKTRKWVVVLVALSLLIVLMTILILWKVGVFDSSNGVDAANEYVNLLVSKDSSSNVFDGTISVMSLESNYADTWNIYNSLRYFDYDSDENISYYNNLKSTLSKIENARGSDGVLADLKTLARSAKELLPRYFVATFLSETNAGYNQYVEYRSFDGFLSEYDFPFGETNDEILQEYDAIINESFRVKKEMYDEISKTECLSDKGVNYECLSMLNSEKINLLQLENVGLNSSAYSVATGALTTIVNNANEMMELFNGEKDV